MYGTLKIIVPLFILCNSIYAQVIVVDAGHGYNDDCSNGDGRSEIEINTAHEVSVRLKNKLDEQCNWTTVLTRPDNGCGSWISLTQRYTMANDWDADVFLSVHCNAGGGTGTETFWCDLAAPPNNEDQAYATEVQQQMVEHGDWTNRRVVEDHSYLTFHLGVLKNLNMNGCLSEIGFVDYPSDAEKLLDSAWRDSFVVAYFEALQNFFGDPCNGVLDTNGGLLCDSAMAVSCGEWYHEEPSSNESNVLFYGCNNWTETGPERVYQVTLQDTGPLVASVMNYTGDLDVYLLDACHPDSCVGQVHSTSAIIDTAVAGTYYIVVDSDNGSGSGFDLVVHCENVPDLYGTNIEIMDTMSNNGSNLSFNWDLLNLGAGNASNVSYKITFSVDSNPSMDDELLYENQLPLVMGAQSEIVENILSLPMNVPDGDYFLILTVDGDSLIPEIDEHNNVSVSSIYLTTIVENGIFDTKRDDIVIYPNPASDYLIIKSTQYISNTMLSIYDIKGSLVYTNKVNGNTISLDLQEFKEGVYILRMLSNHINFTDKIIIKPH